MNGPLVTIVCLCYNQARYVRESVESVIAQSYSPIQLILVDDASTDDSVSKIKQLKTEHDEIELLLLDRNYGNCRAFNKALEMARGDFIIDLAADDVLMPDRVKSGVEVLNAMEPAYSVNFSDATYIDDQGEMLSRHSEKYPHASIPQGDIYRDLIHRYFVCPPSLMLRTSLIRKLGGYDEKLHYEDFDFLVRASRITRFCYTPEVLVKKRVLKNSLSSEQHKLLSRHSVSTYEICRKIFRLNMNSAEKRALNKRIWYEISVNVRLMNVWLVFRYLLLWIGNTTKSYTQ